MAYQSITTKYLGPTNTKGARITARTSSGISITLLYDSSSNCPHRIAAIALIRKLKWLGTWAEGGTNTGHVYVYVPKGASDLFKVSEAPKW
jgi:hypothetical protein